MQFILIKMKVRRDSSSKRRRRWSRIGKLSSSWRRSVKGSSRWRTSAHAPFPGAEEEVAPHYLSTGQSCQWYILSQKGNLQQTMNKKWLPWVGTEGIPPGEVMGGEGVPPHRWHRPLGIMGRPRRRSWLSCGSTRDIALHWRRPK